MEGWRTRAARTDQPAWLTLYRHEDGTISIAEPAGKVIAVADDLIEQWELGNLPPGGWFSSSGAFGFQTSDGMLTYDIIGGDLLRMQWLAIRSDDSEC